MPPSVFGRPTYRELDGAKDIFRTVDDRKPERNQSMDMPNPLSALFDEVTGEAGEGDLEHKNADFDDALPEQNAGANDIAQEVIKEADEKMESISNRQVEASVFSKMSNKTYISVLQKQLNDERVKRE